MSDKVIGVPMQPHVYVLVCMQSTLLHLLILLYCNRKQILYKLLIANLVGFENAGFAECCFLRWIFFSLGSIVIQNLCFWNVC